MDCCLCYCKDTNFKANHNDFHTPMFDGTVVYATAKILILKQITTYVDEDNVPIYVVYATAKILILKQITTLAQVSRQE